jgi:hypothetical protein
MYLCMKLIDRCDEVWVFGEPSEGMQDEIAYAKGKGIRVIFHDLDWADTGVN